MSTVNPLSFHWQDLSALIIPRMGVCRPYLVGITGGVGVGKSTFARQCASYWLRTFSNMRVGLMATDGYIYPNAQLVTQQQMSRKGFPESYDVDALSRDLQAIQRRVDGVRVPIYAHDRYDRVEGAFVLIDTPDVLLVEGLPVDQKVRDMLDFSVYIDAPLSAMHAWYVARSLRYRADAQQGACAGAHFARLADRNVHDALAHIEYLWSNVNQENWKQHIAPFRAQADVVVHKNADHSVFL